MFSGYNSIMLLLIPILRETSTAIPKVKSSSPLNLGLINDLNTFPGKEGGME